MNEHNLDTYLNVPQLSQLLNVRPMTIYGWVHDGMIPHVKLGRLVRFSESEIREWLNKRRKEGRTRREVEVLDYEAS
jgi:excisionase family DNA binding protein